MVRKGTGITDHPVGADDDLDGDVALDDGAARGGRIKRGGMREQRRRHVDGGGGEHGVHPGAARGRHSRW